MQLLWSAWGFQKYLKYLFACVKYQTVEGRRWRPMLPRISHILFSQNPLNCPLVAPQSSVHSLCEWREPSYHPSMLWWVMFRSEQTPMIGTHAKLRHRRFSFAWIIISASSSSSSAAASLRSCVALGRQYDTAAVSWQRTNLHQSPQAVDFASWQSPPIGGGYLSYSSA